MSENYFLGIDIGSVSISIVKVDKEKKIVQSSYLSHEGQLIFYLKNTLKEYNLKDIIGIAITSSTPEIIHNAHSFDNRVSFIKATKEIFPNADALLIVGGEKFGLALFDKKGNYRTYKSNSSCAAGTGSFLDQQSRRLNLENIEHFSSLAFQSKGDFPKIASRCAVFAKTDLIHAQQEGYKLSEICDGLCHGLARNIVDTVFKDLNGISELVFAGGVSQNKAVASHIEKLTGLKPNTHKFGHLFGAYGAVLCMIEENQNHENTLKIIGVDDLIINKVKEKSYFYQPLTIKLSDYPDFKSFKSYLYQSATHQSTIPVEVDLYVDFKELSSTKIYLGIDIGSTSTKALLLDENKNVIAGFYTRTSGQPVIAIQTIFESIDDLQKKYKIAFDVLSVGTTGSGRKFIGKIIGAELVLDEISAHARAAIELDPEVDTIIEIGGQDSKFTTLSNGRVTFSVMNNVCAAGTGSFIEEQAQKLGVSLSEYSKRAEKALSPMASDRCTVFMERDLSHYLNEGYNVDEILASVLHSVRENYLSKVAVGANIGNKVFFQGATAKNRALVAAFEQKLGKPIMVSKYCHLTGALGVALELFDNKVVSDKFRGIGLYHKEIPVHAEVCELCTNHCKLNVAGINGTTEAYGFLCGRDFNDEKFVENNTSGFDLIKSYKSTFRFVPDNEANKIPVVGIPAALYLWEDLFLWKTFFNRLKIKTISSENYLNMVKEGKNHSGAEFCAPISALHGHVVSLSSKADYIFLPVYLEEKQKKQKRRRLYCYYSQYAASLAASITNKELKLISPVLNSLQNILLLKLELFKSMHLLLPDLSILDVSNAYDYAKRKNEERKKNWKNLFANYALKDNEMNVVMLGRPYTVLSQTMNNKIPEIFSKLGVKTFFQDMLPLPEKEAEELTSLLDAFKWNYAAKIVVAADYVAKTKNLYPVLISSFKCTPDSFVVEYFKQILDIYKKPYLVLQLDEHDSSVGYETRIEAAIRSFKNHKEKHGKRSKSTPAFSKINLVNGINALKNKTLLMPNWDDYAVRLLVSTLRYAGLDARCLKDTPSSIQRSLGANTGQCLPLNIILQDAIDYIKENHLNPSDTAIWMINSGLACNLSMFPHYMAKILNSAGDGLEKVNIYLGDLSFVDISMNTSINVYLAYMFGGYIRKIVCKIRPYEEYKGETDRIANKALDYLCKTIEKGESREEALKIVIAWFEAIKTKPGKRPKVAIFGDLYARDNEVLNQDLVRLIEENGGEAITTPYSEYLKIISSPWLIRAFKEGRYLNAATMKFLRNIIPLVENKYYKYFQKLIDEEPVKHVNDIEEKLNHFNVKISNSGESLENLLKIFHIAEQHPDLTLFVQTNPAYCCPSLVTESMAAKIEKLTGIPVLSIEYDGTLGKKNENVIPFLKLSIEKDK
jgi:predicted CoA-substrate-specific enzyme activase